MQKRKVKKETKKKVPQQVKVSAILFFAAALLYLINLFAAFIEIFNSEDIIRIFAYIIFTILSLVLSLLAGFLLLRLNNGGRIFALVLAWINLIAYGYEILNYIYVALVYSEVGRWINLVDWMIWVVVCAYIIISLTNKKIKEKFGR